MKRAQRRRFLLTTSALLAAPFAHAQPPRRVYRIGYPAISPLPGLKHVVAAFEQGLRDHGYVPGKDVVIDVRSADGQIERYPEVVREIVRSKPDVILTGVNANTTAVKAATQTIPIVMIVGSDVVRAGYAKSLAKPGGNITGLTVDVGGDVVAKRLELLREVAPKISRIAILWEPPDRVEYRRALDSGASVLGLSTFWLEYSGDLERDFSEMLRWRADAIFHLPQARMYGRRVEIVALAAKHRLPAAYSVFEYVETGGLMSYGASLSAQFRSAAKYVDKILKGAKPGDLPIEQPTKFELFLNLKTAKALGLTVSEGLRFRADRVIE